MQGWNKLTLCYRSILSMKDFRMPSAQPCRGPKKILHRGISVADLLATSANGTFSDEYWKLYDQYISVLKKLAEVQDSFDKSSRALADAQAAGKSIPQLKNN